MSPAPAYIDKMSDYCEGCRFDPKTTCPFPSLYWAYLGRHHDALVGVSRMRLPLAAESRRSDAQRRADRDAYRRVTGALARGEELVPETLGMHHLTRCFTALTSAEILPRHRTATGYLRREVAGRGRALFAFPAACACRHRGACRALGLTSIAIRDFGWCLTQYQGLEVGLRFPHSLIVLGDVLVIRAQATMGKNFGRQELSRHF